MKMRFKVFRGTFKSWETLFTKASNFAADIGKDRLVNISHCCDHSEGVVTVWYWIE